jgi:hypothetical protein
LGFTLGFFFFFFWCRDKGGVWKTALEEIQVSGSSFWHLPLARWHQFHTHFLSTHVPSVPKHPLDLYPTSALQSPFNKFFWKNF